jgi:hypothetical protein
MKTVIKRMVAPASVTLYKKLLLSIGFMIFFALLLYVLINSPA